MRISYSICRFPLFVLLTFCLSSAFGQLAVTVVPPKGTGEKAIVMLSLKNNFAERIESARATVSLLGDQGKVIAQATKWVIGGSAKAKGLAAGGTNAFYFVVQNSKPLPTTNLTAKITFTRLVLDGGKLVDVTKNVEIK